MARSNGIEAKAKAQCVMAMLAKIMKSNGNINNNENMYHGMASISTERKSMAKRRHQRESNISGTVTRRRKSSVAGSAAINGVAAASIISVAAGEAMR